MATIEATLQNILGEYIQRDNERKQAEFDARKATEKSEEASTKFRECRDIIGQTYKPKQGERKIAFGHKLITITSRGDVSIDAIEHIL